MRVLNLIWKFGTGGIAKCFETYSRLGECDISVNVMSVCIDPQCFDYDRSKLDELGVVCIKIKNPLDFSWHMPLAKIIKTFVPDVVFTHGFHGPMIYLITKFLHRLHSPLIASYHGKYYSPTKGKEWIAPIINNATTFMYNHYCERVVAVSDYSKRELECCGVNASKVVVVHNGIPDITMDECTNINPNPNIIRIGVVSRLDPFKGIDILVNAMPEIVKNCGRKVELEIVGDGPMQNTIKEKIDNLKLDSNVHLLGYRSDVSRLMKSWNVFCLPSFFENHSIAILEAMRAGKAIVTTEVGGNVESVRDGKEALLVPAKSVERLAEAVSQVANDTHLREKLGRNARMRYENEFTEHVMMKNLIKVLTL